MSSQPLRLPEGGLIDRSKALSFNFCGTSIAAFPGDTVASALLAAGVRTIFRSAKHNRPRSVIGLGLGDPDPKVLAEPVEQQHAPEASLRAHGESANAPKEFDVAVIGGGAAGLMAAYVAALAGLSVAIIERSWCLGGWLLHERRPIAGIVAQQWIQDLARRVAQSPNIEIVLNTEFRGLAGDDGKEDASLGCSLANSPGHDREGHGAAALLCRQLILATGAVELPLAFEDNDRPGIMLASAVRGLVNRYAVASGERVLVATNNDSGYLTACDLADAAVTVTGIVDCRGPTKSFVFAEAERRNIPVLLNAFVMRPYFRTHIEGVEIVLKNAGTHTVPCDCLAMTGGLAPLDQMQCTQAKRVIRAGACAGVFSLKPCLSSGAKAGATAAMALGQKVPIVWVAPEADCFLSTRRVTGPIPETGGDPAKIYIDLAAETTLLDLNAPTLREARASASNSRIFHADQTFYGLAGLGFYSSES